MRRADRRTRRLARGLAPLLAAAVAACTAPSLQQQLEARLQGFGGTAGVYVRHLTTGETAAVLADETFPTASMIKVPILGALLTRVARGELDYHARLTYGKERLYPGEDLIGSFADGATVPLDQVAMLMITTSDNTGALWCQELAGTGTAINAWLAAHGCRVTRVNSRTDGRRADWQAFGWGQTTPREMAELVARAHAGALHDAAVSEELLRCMARIHLDATALSQLPPGVWTASKQGAVDAARSEVVLVAAPHGAFVFCVATKDQRDTSWTRDNEGFTLIRDVAALLWRHFEPDVPYTPPAGMQRFW